MPTHNPDGATTAPPGVRLFLCCALAGWTITVGGLLLWGLTRIERDAMDLVRAQARASYDKDVLYRRWNSAHGGIYVPVTDKVQPNPYLDVPNRDLTTDAGQKLTLMNPAWMTREVHELQHDTTGTQGHITSLKPIRPANAPDPWEELALARFAQGESEVSSVEDGGGTPLLRLMRPLLVEEGCLKCHAKQGYELGQVRGGISVSVPLAPTYALLAGQRYWLIGTHALLWACGAVGLVLWARGHSRDLDEVGRSTAAIVRANALLSAEVAERTRLQAALVRVQAAIDGASDAVVILDPEGEPLYTNAACMSRLAGTESLSLARLREIVTPPEALDVAFPTALSGHSSTSEVSVRLLAGTEFPALLRSTGVEGQAGGIDGVLFVITDITDRKALEEHLRRLSTEDPLTALANRRALEQALESEWRRAVRGARPLAVVMVDIDHFKAYNDFYGHVEGDVCLRAVARALRAVAKRPTDVAARYGGEEFVLLLPDTDLEGAERVATQALEAVRAERLEHAASPVARHVTISLGVRSLIPTADRAPQTLLAEADAALFDAKRGGRDRLAVWAAGDPPG
jgi:diguanylate cyclase (GGDEF)-like protein